jgi:hypothetical protein
MEDFSIVFEDDIAANSTTTIESGPDKNIVDLGVVNPVIPIATPEDEARFHKPFDKNDTDDIIDINSNEGNKGNTGDNDNDSNSVTKKYFDFMKESNLLMVPDDFEFDGSSEKLEEAHEKTLATMQELAYGAIMQRLPEEVQGLLQYAIKGGTDYESFLKRGEAFNTETEEGQIAIIKHYYKNNVKWDDAKIERYLTKSDVSDIAQEAEDIKRELEESSSEQRKAKIAEQEALERASIEQQKAVQTKIVDTIGKAGFIEEPRKQPLKNFIFNAVRKEDGKATDFQRALNQIQTNPEHLIQLADLLMDYDKKDGLKYQRFESKAITRVNKDLKAKLEQTVAKKIGSIGNTTKEIDWSKFVG